jgi:16S rRNA (adenine1518-N6/adenine1519-N6)-dimethyltransferase
LECDETLFVKVVKIGFNQRRKTLRNALKQLSLPLDAVPAQLLSLRAEQLSVNDFITLTKSLS